MSSYLSQYINENKKELKSSPINEQARASLTNEQKIEGRQLAKALAQKGDLNISRGDLERLLNSFRFLSIDVLTLSKIKFLSL